jgi:universal stress protein A
MTPITRILVPTDFSDSADAALAYALTLGAQVGATVRLVHAFEDPDAVSLYSHAYVPMPAEMRAEILADLRRQLTARATASGRGLATTEVLTGAAAKAIVDDATQQQCDLIVMGTHGRHGMAHLLLGSVAERVVRTATCPVLVVPRPANSTR